MGDVNSTIEERGHSYGEYKDGAQIAMDLFEVAQEAPSYRKMDAGQRYAMFMFCAKMARVLNGDPNHKDSWHDIAGYATLVEERIGAKPDPDGWIEWAGGPRPTDKLVDVRFRGSEYKTTTGLSSGALRWEHIQSVSDIVAYRISPSPTEDDRRP